MYFDNIGNDELVKLPKIYMPNFNISLTTALSHDLFKIETIIPNRIYKIYPLFNCKSISSSNSNDRIFNNKMIICKKEISETYLTFISDENEPTQDFNNIGSYFNIGDSLTTADYNTIIQLERMYNTIHDPINIQTNILTTDYANYDFKITGLTLDKGIGISSLTDLKIKLLNPVFPHSTYTLNLKVLRILDTSDDNIDENKIIIPITVELIENEYVNIPITDLEIGDLILYDCEIVITHDKPTIKGTVLDSIVLSTNKTIAEINETITLTATLKDKNNLPLPDTSVDFEIYRGGSLVTTLTEDTDSTGVATKTYTCTGGDVTIKAVAWNMDSNSIIVEVTKINTILSIDVPLVLVYSDEFNITGILKDSSNIPIPNANVKLLVGNTVVDTKTTDNNGEVSFTQTPVHMGNHSFKLVYEGDSTYFETASSVVSRNINKETSVLNITLPVNNDNVQLNSSVSVVGTLLSDDGEALSGKNVKVSSGGSVLTTIVSDSNGTVSGSISGLTAGTHTLTISFEGDEYYTSSTVSKTVNVLSVTSISLTSDKNILSYKDNEYATLSATALDGTSTCVADVTISFDIVDEYGTVISNIGSDDTDRNGVATVTYNSAGAGDIKIVAKYGSILSESFVISDVIKYDPSSQSNLSNYTTNNLTFSYDSTKEAYYLKQNNTTNTWGTATLNNITVSDNVKVSIDFYMEHRQNEQVGLQIGNVMFRALNYQRSIDIISVSQTGITSMVSNVVSVATWLTMEVVIANGTGTMTIKQGDTTLGTVSGSVSSYISSSNAFRLAQGVNNSDFSYIKNIKIKPL